MKKPHEQEWKQFKHDRWLVVNEHGEGVFRMQGPAATPESEALAIAAPNMARALLEALGQFEGTLLTHQQVQAVAGMRIALRKAGVLP